MRPEERLRPADTAIPRENVTLIAGVSDGDAAAQQQVNCLIIGQNSKGCWVVKDRLGIKAGIFRSLNCALHFAKEEASAAGLSALLTAEPVELDRY